MKQFVPITDELLYSHDGPVLRLVPYRCGLPCSHDAAARLTRQSGFRDARDDERSAFNVEPSVCRPV